MITSKFSSSPGIKYVEYLLPPQNSKPPIESPSLFATSANHVILSLTPDTPSQYEKPDAPFNDREENNELLPTTAAQSGHSESISESTVVFIDDKPQDECDESSTPQTESLTDITNQNEENECPKVYTTPNDDDTVSKMFPTQNKLDESFPATIHYDVDEGTSRTTAYPSNYKNLDLPSDSPVEYTEPSTPTIAQNVKPIQSASLYNPSLDSTWEPTPTNNIDCTLPPSPSHINNTAPYNTEPVEIEFEDKIETNDESQNIPEHDVIYTLSILYILLTIFRLTSTSSFRKMKKIAKK